MNKKYAFTTLLATDDYLYGVLGLYASMQVVESKIPFHLIVTNNISTSILNILDEVGITYTIFPSLSFTEKDSLYKVTFNKFYVYSLKEYDKVCFIDGDAVLNRNIDDIFEINTPAFLTLNDSFLSGALFMINPNEYSIDFFNQYIDCRGDDEGVWNDIYKFETVQSLSNKGYMDAYTHFSDFGCTKYKYWKYYNLSSWHRIYQFIETEMKYGWPALWHLVQLNLKKEQFPELDNSLDENI